MEVKEYESGYAKALAIMTGGAVVGEARQLLRGHLYRGAIALSLFELPLAGLIKGKLQSGGFDDVAVYDDEKALPAAFGDLRDVPDATHWAEGVYRDPDGPREVPSQVKRLRDDGLLPGVGPPPAGHGLEWWTDPDRIKRAEVLAGEILDKIQTGTEDDRTVGQRAADALAKVVQAARDAARAAGSSAESAWQSVLDTLIRARDIAMAAGKGAAMTFLGLSGTTIVLLVGGFLLYRSLAEGARSEVRRRYVDYRRNASG